ncbi:uncharacterized protein CBL_10442 [Carabus blaptoides fortunei]
MSFTEIKIPISWGHIAGKAWGNISDPLVMVLHGYQDNAGSFDKLIPLLPTTYYYVCLDLPGHGKSSHIPTPTFISFVDFIYTLKYTLDYFNRKKYILLGHSYGAQTCLIFTQIFPAYVSKLITLDAIHYLPISPKNCIPFLRQIITRYEKLHHLDPKTAPSYELEEAVQKMTEQRMAQISDESMKIIMQRSLIPQPDGRYKISLAQHLKYNIAAPMSLSYFASLLKHHPIKCPHLSIIVSESATFKQIAKESFDQLRENKNFEEIVVEGHHDVHVEHPDRVAPIISAFLVKQHSKL